MKRHVLAGIVAVAVASLWSASPVAAAAPSGRTAGTGCPLPQFGPGTSYHPVIHPADFGPDVDNPWFPLPVGTTYVYTGTKDGKSAVDVVEPSTRTKVIDGVRTRVVNDRSYSDGVLDERTSDYYAQDRCGNVWYFGEDTAELDKHGHVTSTEGTWHAGVASAEPGVFMQAHPELRREFRQEWSRGVAEDTFVAIARNAFVKVPYGTFKHALRTRETTALEPGIVDNKYYAYGIGDVQESTVTGGSETLNLTDILS